MAREQEWKKKNFQYSLYWTWEYYQHTSDSTLSRFSSSTGEGPICV